MCQSHFGLKQRIILVVYKIDILLGDKRILVGAESLHDIGAFSHFVGRTRVGLTCGE